MLSIPERATYITVEPGQTAESCTAELQEEYIVTLYVSAVYVLQYGAAWIICGLSDSQLYSDIEPSICQRSLSWNKSVE